MDDRELFKLTLSGLSELLRQRQVSPVEVTGALLDRIERINRDVNAYITVTKEEAMRTAKHAEDDIRSDRYRGPLHGVPLALKDLFATKGVRTTCGSKILAEHVPDFDATVVSKLKAAGAIILGKSNMHEFAYGTTNDSSHFGPVRNPWDLARLSGGSSGGSAAAVSATLCIASIGTDTGGSIRIPSALCGVVGLKPTYGRVSRFGVTPLAWSLDHVGPIAKNTMDAAILLRAIAGHDPRDSTSSKVPVPDYVKGLSRGIRRMRIAMLGEFLEGLPKEVEAAIRTAAESLQDLGAVVQELPVPKFRLARAMGATILASEATAYHEDYLRTKSRDYGEDVRRRLQVGRYILAVQYLRSQQARRIMINEALRLFKEYDAFLTPAVPITAPRVGETFRRHGGRKERIRNLLARFTMPFNFLGLPAISLPCGFSSRELPIGLQLVGRPFGEERLLSAAQAYEEITPWHTKRPPI